MTDIGVAAAGGDIVEIPFLQKVSNIGVPASNAEIDTPFLRQAPTWVLWLAADSPEYNLTIDAATQVIECLIPNLRRDH
ncbi:MAG: hypothetical protein IH943_04895 [Acidobacteria bacterium]|nr:hypothetical protein [Acidobacteriota bacterium]